MKLNTELTRLKIKEGKNQKVEEWMDMLRDNLPATLATLEGEKMYVEAIFSDFEEGFMYWFSVQGEGGIDVHDSDHDVDKKHIEFAHECIDDKHPNFKKDMKLELSMLLPKINSFIKDLEY